MIHVFNGCKEVCTLPGKACSACGQCIQDCEPGCRKLCTPCSDCALACGDIFNDFLNRPLGGYVLMAVWLSLLEMALCGYSLYKEAVPGAVDIDAQLNSIIEANATALQDAPHPMNHSLFLDCKLKDSLGAQVGIKMWIYVQMGMAAINLIFAPYLQCRLWMRMSQDANDPAKQAALVPPAPGRDSGPLALNRQGVKDSFQHVFLHDFGVCFYVFALIFSYFWSQKGIAWAKSDPMHCDPNGWLSRSGGFGTFFVWFTILYACGWYCYMQCMGTTEGLMIRSRGAPIPQYQNPEAASASREDPLTAPAQQGGLFSKAAAFARPQPSAAQEAPPAAAAAAPPEPRSRCTGRQFAKLVACIGLDFMGNASYFLPALGEVGDAGWAPAQAVMLKMLFDANGIAALGFIEELLPGTDIIPTATIAWCLETFLPDHPFTRALGLNPSWGSS